MNRFCQGVACGWLTAAALALLLGLAFRDQSQALPSDLPEETVVEATPLQTPRTLLQAMGGLGEPTILPDLAQVYRELPELDALTNELMQTRYEVVDRPAIVVGPEAPLLESGTQTILPQRVFDDGESSEPPAVLPATIRENTVELPRTGSAGKQ